MHLSDDPRPLSPHTPPRRTSELCAAATPLLCTILVDAATRNVVAKGMLFRTYSHSLTRLIKEQDGLCAYCRRTFNDTTLGARPTRDHVIPKVAGGSNNHRNLVAACHDCNRNKGGDSVEEFCRQFGGMSAYIAKKGHRTGETILSSGLLTTKKNRKAPTSPARVGPQNPPHSKNAPLKRLFTPEDVRQWDEDRFNRTD